MMKIIFWQNIVSPHLSYFLSKLGDDYEVILIVNSMMSDERKSQGWSVPHLNNVEIVEITDLAHIHQLIERYKSEINIFSGFSSMNILNLRYAFQNIIKHTKVFIISESPIQQGIKTFGRQFLYKLYYLKYRKRINHIFAMGNIGVEWFKKSGFPNEKITPFCYFIEPSKKDVSVKSFSHKTRYLFVGQLIRRKGIDNFIEALSELDKKEWNLKIVGKGVEEDKIRNLISKNNIQDHIEFLGTVKNENILNLVKESDYLVLPSRFDGWGAVISEALSVGTKVICSDKCGASAIVSQEMGYVYREGDKLSFVETLKQSLIKKDYDQTVIISNYAKKINDKIKEFVDKIKSV